MPSKLSIVASSRCWQGLANQGELLPEPRPEDLQVGLDRRRAPRAGALGDDQLLDVELVLDLGGQLRISEPGEGLAVRSRGDQAGQGLAHP